MKRNWQGERGMSLIEIMVVALIFSVIGFMTYYIMGTELKFFAQQQEFGDIILEGSAGLTIMAQDIQLMGADKSGTIFSPSGATFALGNVVDNNGDGLADEITIRSDRNGNGVFENTIPNEEIRFRVFNGHLVRNGVRLVENVTTRFATPQATNFYFRFFNESGTEMTLAQVQVNGVGGSDAVTLIKAVVGVEQQVRDPNSGRHAIRWMSVASRIQNR